MALLERAEVSAGLDALLAQAAGAGRVALVCGEAGIGKSSVVADLLARHRGRIRPWTGYCDPLLTPRALGPVHDVARTAGGRLAEVVAAGGARDAVFAALLDALDTPGPTPVLVLEDLHWADAATLDLLVLLGRRLPAVRALVVGTYRDDELTEDHPLRRALASLPAAGVGRFALPPLSAAAVAALAGAAGRPVGDLYRRTGGNPLLVDQMLAAGTGEVSRTVADLVLGRLAALPGPVREAVRLVSVLPGQAEEWLLRAVLDAARPVPDPAGVTGPPLPDPAATGGLLVATEGGLRLRHELLREVVYDDLPAARRRDLHRAVLTVLVEASTMDGSVRLGAGGPVNIARLVHHARLAGDAEAVCRHAPAAGRQAAQLGAHREAAGHYRAALDYAERFTPPQRAALLEGYSQEAYLAGWSAEAVAARERALALWRAAGDPDKEGENLRWLSRVAWWAGRPEQARSAAAQAVAVLEDRPPGRQLALAYSNQAQLYMLEHRMADAVAWGSRAIDLARRLDDPETLAHALTNVGTAKLYAGDGSGAGDLAAAHDLAVAHRLPDHAARALVNRAFVAVELHDYPAAGELVERALGFATRHDLAGYRQYLTGVRAAYRLDVGDWAGAATDVAAALDMPEQPGVSTLPALVTLGRLYARREDPRAAAVLDRAHAGARASDELQRLGPVAAARAEYAWLCGDADRCVAEAAAAYPLAVRLGHPRYTGELASWLRRAGRPVEAPDRPAGPYRPLLAGDWAAAAAAWERLGCPYERALALAEGDADAVRAALRLLDGLGATATARLVRDRLRRRGERHIPRPPRPATAANPAGLTARQMQVLQLLAGGSTNPQIAARLRLSTRTVDHHVAAVLAKLDVGSRTEAPAAARARGIALESRPT